MLIRMYLKKPVIVRIRPAYRICEAVMELYHANALIKRWKVRTFLPLQHVIFEKFSPLDI
jgi:hypothetical protein